MEKITFWDVYDKTLEEFLLCGGLASFVFGVGMQLWASITHIVECGGLAISYPEMNNDLRILALEGTVIALYGVASVVCTKSFQDIWR